MTIDKATSPLPQFAAHLPGEDCFALRESVTTDADDHAAGLQHWHQDYEQLSTGAFRGTLDEAWFGNVQVFREQTNQVVHETGLAWEGSRTIGVPIEQDGEGLFCGATFDAGSIITLGEGNDLDFRTPRALDIIAVTVDAHALKEFGETVWHLDMADKLPCPGVLACAPAVPARLREFLTLLMASIKSSPKMLNYPQIRKGMEQEIYNNIVLAVADTSTTGTTTDPAIAPSRKAVVDRVREYILAHREEPVTVADLCAVLNVSRRTLQYSFQVVLNVNPVAYLRAVRLNGTRRALRAAADDPHATVADIAARWGFWHLSHFASDYKLMFGELPSQTLRSKH